ncbi:hypothetical protein [Serratia fonticola]|nr:hypothetical protein [Serratia fonticola]MBP0997362.1 hypothetical protein [Serratia fonticola]MBP1002886.1 hypothetical protein [Serratia fonticola]MBP1012822.1 hypothetical protein [Serratia fonticola]MBP1018051.1 hypothetical protein [Serratia fonticola]
MTGKGAKKSYRVVCYAGFGLLPSLALELLTAFLVDYRNKKPVATWRLA